MTVVTAGGGLADEAKMPRLCINSRGNRFA
jgi:hypothetical protein